MSAQPVPVLVLLKQRYQQLNAGEIGGYDEATAAALVKREIGEYAPKAPSAKTARIPAALVGKREAAAQRVEKSREALKAAQEEVADAAVALADAEREVDHVRNPPPKMVLVRLLRRFGSLNGRAVDDRGRVIREGEIGGYDEATAARLTKADNRTPAGDLIPPIGEIVTEEEAANAMTPDAPAPKKLVLIRLRRRFGSLNGPAYDEKGTVIREGEIGGYDEETAALLLKVDPKLGPTGELVDEAAVLQGQPAPQIVDPALTVVGDRRTQEQLDTNDEAFRKHEEEKAKAGRRQ